MIDQSHLPQGKYNTHVIQTGRQHKPLEYIYVPPDTRNFWIGRGNMEQKDIYTHYWHWETLPEQQQ